MPHPNESIIRQLLISCAPDCHDPSVLRKYLDEQAVYHIPGLNVLSGEYKGWEAIHAMTQRRAQLLQNRQHEVKLVGTTVSNEHVAILHQFEADSPDGRLRWRGNSVYFVKQGKITECWLFVDDEDAFNAFWGPA
ncbi:MAG: nuclear transport factor 2 family protein [Chloroflexi bacterium]|nr:nuclear transport factor 2 family protein [Chloroflexota bacterium]